MTQEATEIEVEVVEIDGVAPTTPQRHAGASPQRGGNRQPQWNWQGRDFNLDRRWWPLWIFLGIIAVALVLTVGVVIGVVFLVFRIIAYLVRAILNLIPGIDT